MRLVAEAACAEGETIHNMPGGVDSDQSTPRCWWPTSMVSASCRNGNKPEQNTRRQPVFYASLQAGAGYALVS